MKTFKCWFVSDSYYSSFAAWIRQVELQQKTRIPLDVGVVDAEREIKLHLEAYVSNSTSAFCLRGQHPHDRPAVKPEFWN